MATYDLTAAGGTTGHPANGRTPYLVENTIDVSAINGDSGAAQNDVLRALDIPCRNFNHGSWNRGNHCIIFFSNS